MIRLAQLGVGYGHRPTQNLVLKDLDLDVPRGGSLAVVGESGAGKSTLAKVLLRLLTPSFGTYHFDDQDVARLEPAQVRAWRRRVQAVFQNPLLALNPRVRIDVALTEPILTQRRLSRAQRRRTAGELLELVGLPGDAATRYPHQLSGGQLQRIAIARALGTSPELIVLDEPVSALDVSVRAQIIELLRDLRQERGLTYIYITHDLSTVPLLSERVAVLYRGQIVEEMPVERMFTHAAHPYTRLLAASVPVIGRTAFPDLVEEPGRLQGGCDFAPRCPSFEHRCAVEPPTLRRVGATQRSRCHVADQLIRSTATSRALDPTGGT